MIYILIYLAIGCFISLFDWQQIYQEEGTKNYRLYSGIGEIVCIILWPLIVLNLVLALIREA